MFNYGTLDIVYSMNIPIQDFLSVATFFPLGHVQTPPSRELLQSCSQLSEVHNVVAEIKKMVKLQLPLEALFFQIIAPVGYNSITHTHTYIHTLTTK